MDKPATNTPADNGEPQAGKPRTPRPAKGAASRKGQWQPTREQKRKLIAMVADMLAAGYYKPEIKAAVREYVYKKCDGPERLTGRTCEEYLSRGKVFLLQVVQKSTEELRAESARFYQMMKRKAEFDSTKLRAQERLDRLLGLEKPVITEDAIREYLGQLQAGEQ